MKNNSLIILLKTFSKPEIRLFEGYLNSTYFNNRKAVSKLFDILKTHYPHFKSEDISNENIFKQLFPGKKYNGSTFRVILSCLNDLAIKFLTQLYFEKDIAAFNFLKVQALLERNYLKGVDKIIDSSLRKISDHDLESKDIFLHKYNFYEVKLYYHYSKYSGIFEKFLLESGLEKGFESLTNYYFSQVLRTYLLILNLKAVYSEELDASLIRRVYSSIDINNFRKSPLIQIYFYLVELHLKPNNDDVYIKVRNLFLSSINKLMKESLGEIFVNLENYCSRKKSGGSINFKEEKFEWYKLELKYKSYFLSGFMPDTFFRSVVSSALSANKAQFAVKFINEYTKDLRKESANNTSIYCRALCEFERGNYSKSLDYLSKIRLDDLYMKLDTKVMTMMNYYEMEYDEALISSTEAFRQFLNNNKLISKNKLEYYKNFCKFIRKLLNLKDSKDGFQVIKFKETVSSNKHIIQKDWFLKQLEEMDKKVL